MVKVKLEKSKKTPKTVLDSPKERVKSAKMPKKAPKKEKPAPVAKEVDDEAPVSYQSELIRGFRESCASTSVSSF